MSISITKLVCCYRSEECKQAAVCLGKQQEGDIFVFNAECKLNLNGTPVANPPVLLPGKYTKRSIHTQSHYTPQDNIYTAFAHL